MVGEGGIITLQLVFWRGEVWRGVGGGYCKEDEKVILCHSCETLVDVINYKRFEAAHSEAVGRPDVKTGLTATDTISCRVSE